MGLAPGQDKASCARRHTAQQLDNNGREDGRSQQRMQRGQTCSPGKTQMLGQYVTWCPRQQL